jgi:hypothetical protein
LKSIKLLTEKTNEFAVLVVGLDSLIESPNNIVASWGLPATEDNANPALGTKGIRFTSLRDDFREAKDFSCIGT